MLSSSVKFNNSITSLHVFEVLSNTGVGGTEHLWFEMVCLTPRFFHPVVLWRKCRREIETMLMVERQPPLKNNITQL